MVIIVSAPYPLVVICPLLIVSIPWLIGLALEITLYVLTELAALLQLTSVIPVDW
jgi:hypothetical protein